ncbi:rod shape-determining protein RodA [Psychrosphaera sp. B3R10]|uniref:rod shape-determining protein RodA n=1 Tax=unclassified Psychrosphaera TaxID=2641570 RepID=UPI001C083E0C|nr:MULTISPECIES: rod shape-determining protein RodA [unclassified Psychrosphaera]MBU2880976.1 rod shape-determining protein RodA [Psychrosphaera sp. I2R16]MBU2990805.1 rod shape-determining protein RodA [Psychrosphaera sp. B3R10]MDO6720501.1 rod shape-determining protein RodA [Psychrosphaera sp. 1_MG-2023]
MAKTEHEKRRSSLFFRFHIDIPLLLGILTLMALSMCVVYSAGGQNMDMVIRQAVRLGIGIVVMIVVAQISPFTYQKWAPHLYILGVAFLLAVLLFGDMGKGAQRWLDLKIVKFQPSEVMKLALPMMMAWFLSVFTLPPSSKNTLFSFIIIAIPTLLIAKQPDLGTAILVASSGFFVLFLAGLRFRIIIGLLSASVPFLYILWNFLMHGYQKQRVLTFLNPESDPLGSGYHIIQSKIAIGSGGTNGKGFLHGTQSQLEFLPERHTDFIFSVFSEEFGFIGVLMLMSVYAFIIARGIYIAVRAQEGFAKLLAGSLILTFFVYLFVNIGMVSGLLPVVGVPLPLVSYGGTSIVTLMASFGILMAISTNKRLLAS